jgi:hypothetical protein
METALTVLIWCVVLAISWPVLSKVLVFILMIAFMLLCKVVEVCTGEDIPVRLKITKRKQAEK